MTLTEEVFAQAALLAGELTEAQTELLKLLCAAAVSSLSARLKDPGDRREVKRAVDALLRRGHTYSQIQRALRTLEMENDDDFREE